MASICSLSAAALPTRALSAVSAGIGGTGAQSLLPAASSSTSAYSAVSLGPVRPLASRRCDLTGKRANNGYRVSFSHHRTKHLQGVNLQYKRLWWAEANRFVKMRISTKALKTIEKKGLAVMAKEAGINLLDFAV